MKVIERKCSFCDQTVFECRVLFEGCGGAYICATCILVYSSILNDAGVSDGDEQ